MKINYLPYIITFLSGISTLLGIIPTFINKKYSPIIIKYSLLLSSLVMISVSILSLIPEAINYYKDINIIKIMIIIIFIVLGIIITNLINSLSNINNNLYKVGLISLFAIILHNIPEGIATYISSVDNINIGIKIAITIMLHNIPEGIIISIPIYYSTNNRLKAFTYTFIAGFSELFGAIIAHIFIEKYINNLLMVFLLSVTAGIMINLSLNYLLKEYLKIKKQK